MRYVALLFGVVGCAGMPPAVADYRIADDHGVSRYAQGSVCGDP